MASLSPSSWWWGAESLPWLVAAAAVGAALAVHLVVRTLSPKRQPLQPHEAVFRDDPADLKAPGKPFPSIFDPASLYLSIIVPAYKEEKRLPKTLRETLDHLEERQRREPSFTYEIIVVDDGSPDLTAESAKPFIKEVTTEKLRILRLARNRGKGGAVTAGVNRARGQYILFADADGATAVREIGKLEQHVKSIEKDGLAIGVGSRAHLVGTDVVVKRSLIRNILMRCFHVLVYVLGVKSIKDTQCGFKMCSREAARRIFPAMHVEGWIFDIEMLILAEMLHIPMIEVGVEWEEVAGSKMNLLKDSFVMIKDMFVIRYNYTVGAWHPRGRII